MTEAKKIHFQNFTLFILIALLFVFISCKTQPEGKALVFTNYPNLKIGLTTQNFQKAMPVNVESLTEIIEYASKEGYQFIELRDDSAKLSVGECKALAIVARKKKIDVIYEIHESPLNSGYFKVFERSLINALQFPDPGILRAMLSMSEFEEDTSKKGWTKDELIRLSSLSDSCALIAKAKNIQFIVENLNEPFFGDGLTYFGLTDFFANTSGTGLQFDIGNPFRSQSREKADPVKVIEYLPTLGKRWVSSHIKTVLKQGGESQQILTDNPLSIEKAIEMMGQNNVTYVAIEISAVAEKQQCFNNHATSIKYLKNKGVLKN